MTALTNEINCTLIHSSTPLFRLTRLFQHDKDLNYLGLVIELGLGLDLGFGL